jgi:hypothetical protein
LEKLTFEMRLEQFWLYGYCNLGFAFSYLHLVKIKTFKCNDHQNAYVQNIKIAKIAYVQNLIIDKSCILQLFPMATKLALTLWKS